MRLTDENNGTRYFRKAGKTEITRMLVAKTRNTPQLAVIENRRAGILPAGLATVGNLEDLRILRTVRAGAGELRSSPGLFGFAVGFEGLIVCTISLSFHLLTPRFRVKPLANLNKHSVYE